MIGENTYHFEPLRQDYLSRDCNFLQHRSLPL